MLRMIDIVGDNLFPKNEFKSEPIVALTDSFSRAYLREIKNSNEVIELDLTLMRRIVFGLSATCENENQIVTELLALKSKQLLRHDLNSYIKNLSAQILIITEHFLNSGSDKKFLTVEQWEKVIKHDFKFISNILSFSIEEPSHTFSNLPASPSIIKSYLDQYYFGPEEIKETISRLIYEHLYSSTTGSRSKLPKRNILLLGPSGCGKTYVIKKIAEYINRPFISFDVTKMSRTGYYGDKVEDILSLVYKNAGTIDKMKNSIIFLDEVDKLAANHQYGSAEVSTTGVQLDLLKFIEGHQYRFNTAGHRDSSGSYHEIDTSNLLIICGGAFEGINKIIERRKKMNVLGFNSSDEISHSTIDDVRVEDLIGYGMIKEFASRFQLVLPMPERNVDDLFGILFSAEDSVIKNYIEYFRAHNCNLVIQKDAMWQIADYAHKQQTGARGLIRILEKVLPLYSVGNRELSEFTLTKEIVVNKLGY